MLCIPRTALFAALDRCPGSSLEVMRILAGRLRKLAGVVEDLSLRDVTGRIAAYLVRGMALARSDTFKLPATRDELPPMSAPCASRRPAGYPSSAAPASSKSTAEPYASSTAAD